MSGPDISIRGDFGAACEHRPSGITPVSAKFSQASSLGPTHNISTAPAAGVDFKAPEV